MKSGISDLTKEDGSKTKSDEEKAEVLDFFASVFTREDTTDIPEPHVKYDGAPL